MTAYRHLETYAPDTGAGVLLIHLQPPFSIIQDDLRCGRAKRTLILVNKISIVTQKFMYAVPGSKVSVSIGGHLTRMRNGGLIQLLAHMGRYGGG